MSSAPITPVRSEYQTRTSRKGSTMRGKTDDRLTPSSCTRYAAKSATSTLTKVTGQALGERVGVGDRRQQVDVVEGTEVDHRRDLDVEEELGAGTHRAHDAEGDATPVDAVDAGGDDAVAWLHVGVDRHV